MLLNNSLFNVPCVASTPIFLETLFFVAGFIAGSTPIIGISIFFLRSFIAFVVAVLQATIISLHFFFNNQFEMAKDLS